jgi:hypothetical protein
MLGLPRRLLPRLLLLARFEVLAYRGPPGDMELGHIV